MPRFGEISPTIFGPENPVPQDWESLKAKINEFAPQAQYDIELAFQISEAAHSKQVRASGEPFFTHPLRATYYLLAAGCKHRHHVIACLMHDVPEDTDYLEVVGADFYPPDSLYRFGDGRVDAIERLANLFGSGTSKLIDTVTKPGGIEDKAELAFRYREKMLKGHPASGIIKMPDTFDNLTTLGHLPSEKIQRKIREYEGMDDVYTRALKIPANRNEGLILYSWVRGAISSIKAQL